MTNEVMLIDEPTPNPDAFRIVSNLNFKEGKSISIKKGMFTDVDLVNSILSIDNVEEIYLFENFLTVIKSKDKDWSNTISQVKDTIKTYLPFHNPNFVVDSISKDEEKKKNLNRGNEKEISKIEKILDKNVRSALQADGGDLEIIELKDKVLTIEYKGACSSCPSATLGTLKGIEDVLRREYDRAIELKSNNSNPSFEMDFMY